MKKNCEEFCQFTLILPIKIYYIPDFENVSSREKKVMANFFGAITPSFYDLEKIFILINLPKLAKIIRVL